MQLSRIAIPGALLALAGALLLTAPAEAGKAPCRPGKHNGFRLYCHVAVKFTLDGRKFSFTGGTCGHGQGEWGFSSGPGAVTEPAKGWMLSVHFGWLDYGKAVDRGGTYGPANGYDDIHVSMSLKAGAFVTPQSSLDVVDTATVSISSDMTRGSYRARVAWASTAKKHTIVGTVRCW
jgi:hypothetical protein